MRVPSGLGSMMRNIDILACYAWQVVLFGQQLTALSIAGSLLIIWATIGQALRKLYAQRHQAPSGKVPERGNAVDGRLGQKINDLTEVQSPLYAIIPAVNPATAEYLRRFRGEGQDI